ncbi:MAG: hypothetical protein JRJ50_15705 [Deltaproteobacteria bacterium]|nr:hypothetical protein [Deltaproteobacteria bacterium]
MHEIQKHHAQEEAIDSQEIPVEKRDTGELDLGIQEDEYFAALCASFSDKEREKAYHGYGDAFKQGYLALNHGNFKLAATRLLQSMEENPLPKTYIPLELGAAYLNLGKIEEARGLLISFLKDYPGSLQGYQMLCEALWEVKEFDEAHNLLQTCNEELAESSHILLLRGETLFAPGKSTPLSNGNIQISLLSADNVRQVFWSCICPWSTKTRIIKGIITKKL